MSTPRTPLTADDLREAIRTSCIALRRLEIVEWNQPAAGLEWTRLKTIGHVIDAYAYCISNLANQTTDSSAPRILAVPEMASPNDILASLPVWSEVLVQVASVASLENARGFHRWGRPDAEGYLSMACVEILVHTYDVLQDKKGFEAVPDLASKILGRLFPWADKDTAPWRSLLWATGRVELPGKENMSGRWAWHCDPLEEWNGELKIWDTR